MIKSLEEKVQAQDRQWEDDLIKLRETLSQLHSVRLTPACPTDASRTDAE